MSGKLKNKGNILLVANWESNAGYAWWLMENFWITISRHFSKQNKNSFLIYPKITTIPQSIASSDINTSELNFFNHDIKNLIRLHRFIKSNNIQFIYLSDSSTYNWFYLLLRLWGVRKIVVHDHTPGERTPATGLKKSLKILIQKLPYFTADHFIAVTKFVNQRHMEVNCIPEKKCSYASNGIKPFESNNTTTDYTQQQFNIPDNRCIIVTTGRASYYKGIDFYIRCANELINIQGKTNFHFLFCGDGPDMDDFKKLCSELALDEYFTFAGKRTDIREILPSCDIGFHAAKGEVGYSLSILEYMSAGLVTIVPDNPSTAGATEESITGLLYTPNNLNSACNAILNGNKTEIRKALTHNARQEVLKHYDIDGTNKKLISILDRTFRDKP